MNENKQIDLIDLSIDDDVIDEREKESIQEFKKFQVLPINNSYLASLPITILTPQSSLNSEINYDLYKTIFIKDAYCWICHLDCNIVSCQDCVRSYHLKCLGLQALPSDNWTCIECQCIQEASKERRMFSKVKPEQFYLMLDNALKRLKYPGVGFIHTDSEPFLTPVDLLKFQDYKNYIVRSMDLSLMERKIREREYQSLEEFLADIKLMVHNSSIYNGVQSKLTLTAKSFLRMIKHEINEMEVCPDCYLNSILKFDDNWFCEPCRTPHPLIWAKMKGFPFWPAKALRIVNGDVDVRFFGAHDRSWIHMSKCFWLSKNAPSSVRQRFNNLQRSLDELDSHIQRLIKQFGEFVYAPHKLTIDPEKPFVFLPNLKDLCCLPYVNDNSKNARKIFKERTNSCDGDSLCSTKFNDTSETNSVVNEGSFQSSSNKKEKRKINSSKSNKSSQFDKDEKPLHSKRQRSLESNLKNDVDNLGAKTASNFSLSSISSSSSTSSSSSGTATTKATISISTRDGESSDMLSDNSYSGEDNNNNNNNTNNSNINRSNNEGEDNKVNHDEDDNNPLEVTSLKEPDYLKTLFAEKREKPITETNEEKNENLSVSTQAPIETSTNLPVVDLGNIVKNCKNALGLENVDLLKNSEFVHQTEIKIEEQQKQPEQQPITFNSSPSPSKKQTKDEYKQKYEEIKVKVDEYKKLIEEKSKKEMEVIKQDFERLIKEIQYNSDLRIKEIISECTREKFKIQKKYEKLVEDAKRKQWCSNCYKEAIYYCCWNTSYCDEECQKQHWTSHMNNCLRDCIGEETCWYTCNDIVCQENEICKITRYCEHVWCSFNSQPKCIQEYCLLPNNSGVGFSNLTRYFYDYPTNKCYKFLYKGYVGNKNNFKTKRNCEFACNPFYEKRELFKPDNDVINFLYNCTNRIPMGLHLTFDDGPFNITQTLLDILRRRHIKATFFVLAKNALLYPNLIKQMIEDGHTVGGHFDINDEMYYLEASIINLEEVIRNITGQKPWLFRLKDEKITSDVLDYFNKKGFLILEWNIDSKDDKVKNIVRSIGNLKREHKNEGGIVVLHDHVKNTVFGFNKFIEAFEFGLKDYRPFISLEECLKI